MQKSEVNKRTFRSRVGSRVGSRIGSLGQLFFDILEPQAVQKYSIIRFYKVFWAW